MKRFNPPVESIRKMVVGERTCRWRGSNWPPVLVVVVAIMVVIVAVFGAFLLYTAIRLATHSTTEVHPDKNIILRVARRFFRVSKGDHREHGEHFFVRENGRLSITPLLLVLLVIESTDLLFAVDSVPASACAACFPRRHANTGSNRRSRPSTRARSSPFSSSITM